MSYTPGPCERYQQDSDFVDNVLDFGASPALLAACKLACQALDPRQSWSPELADKAYRELRAAVAQATGSA